MNNPLRKWWLPLLGAVLMGLAGCQQDKPAQKLDPAKVQTMPEPVFRKEGELEFVTAAGEKHRIDIEIADNENDRSLGLMYRKQMDANRGMLFIFETEAPQAFWMHNTFIPLDIIYIDAQMRIVSMVENAATLNDTSLPSAGPAMYVVEVNGGFCKEKGIKVGDTISYKVAI
jgi:uncharacterized membrane protein (UPF0127 family)